MDISKKKSRPKAITPKGFRDNFHSYLKKREEVLQVVNRVYELYGFERLETPAVETLDAVTGVSFVHFTELDVVRHPLVSKIVKAYSNND